MAIGRTVEVYSIGEECQIIGETDYSFYQELIPVWIVNASEETLFYEKDSGVLISKNDTIKNEMNLIFTNLLNKSYNIHNVACYFEKPITHKGFESTLEVVIANTGLFQEITIITIDVDGEELNSDFVNINECEYIEYNFTWTPSLIGKFILSVELSLVSGEKYGVDNSASYEIEVNNLENYNHYYIPFKWLNAQENGIEGNLTEGTYFLETLPFNFTYYGITFDKLYVSASGKVTLVEESCLQSVGTYPSGCLLDISISWTQLDPSQGDIFIWNTTDFFVIEYNNMSHLLSEDFRGTFEIVLFKNGSIVFQYMRLESDLNVTTGLNFGYNQEFFSVFRNEYNFINNYSIIFTLDVFEYHDVGVFIESPLEVGINKNSEIIITITNLGTALEPVVTMSLYIDQIEVLEGENIYTINAGDFKNISYFWVPKEISIHNITVTVTKIDKEIIFLNNRDSSFVGARGINITRPIVGESISGSRVGIIFEYTNETLFHELDVYVEGERVVSIDELYNNEIVTPIFTNGTNNITLEITWMDNISALTSVEIESFDVTPIVNVKMGDYFVWRIVDSGSNEIRDLHYTFLEYVTDFEINVSLVIKIVEEENITYEDLNFMLNTLNSYIIKSNKSIVYPYSNFCFFQLCKNELLFIDNETRLIYYNWNLILEYDSFTSWNDYGVYKFSEFHNGFEVRSKIHNSTGFLLYFEDPSRNIVEYIIDSSFIPLPDMKPPRVNNPNDIELEERTIGRKIEWTVKDDHPGYYTIFINAKEIISANWSDNEKIVVNISSNAVSLDNYTIIVYDKYNNSVIDTVMVRILNVQDPPLVELISPNGRKNFSDNVVISWNAYDPDGDVLEFSLYHWDGLSWIIIEKNLNGTSYEWDISKLPSGRSYKIRVVATDGVLISIDESDDFFSIIKSKKTDDVGFAHLILSVIIIVFLKRKKIKKSKI